MIQAARNLSADCDALCFGSPVTHVYNPLDYAWAAHEQYLNLAATTKKKVVFLGMNPGPFGMAQSMRHTWLRKSEAWSDCSSPSIVCSTTSPWKQTDTESSCLPRCFSLRPLWP